MKVVTSCKIRDEHTHTNERLENDQGGQREFIFELMKAVTKCKNKVEHKMTVLKAVRVVTKSETRQRTQDIYYIISSFLNGMPCPGA